MGADFMVAETICSTGGAQPKFSEIYAYTVIKSCTLYLFTPPMKTVYSASILTHLNKLGQHVCTHTHSHAKLCELAID